MPTEKELQTLVATLRDLIHCSQAHLGLTTKRPGLIDLYGKDVFSWGDLNAATHRAKTVLEDLNV